MAATPLLSVRDVRVEFGGIRAVNAPSFDVPPASVVSLIGPNGAGKTTLLNSISGFVRAEGSIRFDGRELLGQPAHRRASLGIGRTFQNLQLFESMSLVDNVLTGRHALMGGGILLDVLRFPVVARERQGRERSMDILRRLGLDEYADRPADDLPFGVQKLAGVARALAAEPRLLLLDEPAAGLNRQESETLGRLISDLRNDFDVTILLVEHNMRLVMSVSDWVVVLDEGRKLAEGEPAEISRNPAVIEAYLGTSAGSDLGEELRDELSHRS